MIKANEKSDRAESSKLVKILAEMLRSALDWEDKNPKPTPKKKI